MSSLQNSAGVYQIRVDRGGDGPPMFYIGQAAIFRKRRNRHFRELARGIHKNNRLQRAFDRYGSHALSFQVILVCERHPDILNLYEQSVLDAAAPEHIFNILLECVGSRLGIPMSPETKAKIGAANRGRSLSDEHRQAVSLANQTRVVSAETRAKMSAARIGNKNSLGKRLSQTRRAEIAAFFTGKKKHPDEIARRQATRAANRAAQGAAVY